MRMQRGQLLSLGGPQVSHALARHSVEKLGVAVTFAVRGLLALVMQLAGAGV